MLNVSFCGTDYNVTTVELRGQINGQGLFIFSYLLEFATYFFEGAGLQLLLSREAIDISLFIYLVI